VNVEGRERFFRAIAERIDVDRVEEVHVFPAIRQGGRESGVAVVTLRPQEPERDVAEQGRADDAEQVADAADDRSVEDVEGVDELVGASAEAEEAPLPPPPPPRRFTVLRAHYRLQLKGPDRGKWEVGVVEEADAPAATVDEVVRGVHERAGGWSVEGPEHLTGDEFRAALAEEPWSATR
jgi:hypothetical protein